MHRLQPNKKLVKFSWKIYTNKEARTTEPETDLNKINNQFE